MLTDVNEPREEEKLIDRLGGVPGPAEPPDEDMLSEAKSDWEPTGPPKEKTSVLNDGEALLVIFDELAVVEAVAEGEKALPGKEDELLDPPKRPAEEVMSPDTVDDLLEGREVSPLSVDKLLIRPLPP